MSSAEYSCRLQTYFCIQSNSVDPDQTAPKGAVWSGSTLFAKQSDQGPHCLQKWLLKSQAEAKADNSCDWRFNG